MIRRESAPAWERTAWAAAAALAVHAGLLALWQARSPGQQRAAPVARADAPAAPAAIPERATPTEVAAVIVIDDVPPGLPLAAVAGPADQAAWDGAHPLPLAGVDIPGQHAATRGGGARGGPESWTGRRDPGDLRSRLWNDPTRNRQPRTRTADQRTSPEFLARTPERGFDDRTAPRTRARAGDHVATHGPESGPDAPGTADAPAVAARDDWDDADPLLDAAMGRARTRRVDGSTAPDARERRVLAGRGAPATEALRRGVARDDVNSADRSNVADPGPFELTRPSAGGRTEGVRGSRAQPGVAPRGTGTGEAASRRDVRAGSGLLAVLAHRDHPYFRVLYERLDRRVKYPRKLALRLEQGQLVVRFTLAASGEMSALSLIKSSGFAEFDREVVRALRALAPFGTVPSSLLKGRRAVTVQAPYAFKNPLIR